MRTGGRGDERRQGPLPPAGHDDPGEVPPVLHLRARVPGQGHPDPRRPGERHPDALHRLRQLRHRVQPERQAGAQRHRGHRGTAAPATRRSPPSWRRATRPSSRSAARPGWSAPSATSASPRSTRSASEPTSSPRSTRACSSSRTAAHIATTCPAVVSYVRKYHPDILDSLAPIVSPMIATARVLHQRYGPDLKIVFIGPCIAKKGEAPLRAVRRRGRRGAHLRRAPRPVRRARRQPLRRRDAADDDFDPPHGSLGALFPITRGHAAGGRPRRRPDGRRHRQRRRPPEPRRGHHRLRARRHRGPAARHPVLRGLHHGRRLQLRGAGVQAPLGRQPRDARAPERLRPGGLGSGHGRVRRRGPLAHLPALRPALRRHAVRRGARGDPGAHGQVRARGRAELRGLRLRHLPRARRGHLAGPGRGGDVPAVHHRGAAQDGRRAAGVQPARWRPPRRRWSRARSSPAWASSRPASRTRSTTRWASC